jgi:hypothetical protein
MTAQQYLLTQAEFCRRAANESADPLHAEELIRLAKEFEANALAPAGWNNRGDPRAARAA